MGSQNNSVNRISLNSYGTFQIDRGTNGSIRVSTYFSIGTELADVAANPAAVDLALTDLNAITLPPTSLAASAGLTVTTTLIR